MQGMSVEPQTLLDVSGAVPESVTSSVLDACHNRGFSGIQEAITDAIASGWGVSTLATHCSWTVLYGSSNCNLLAWLACMTVLCFKSDALARLKDLRRHSSCCWSSKQAS